MAVLAVALFIVVGYGVIVDEDLGADARRDGVRDRRRPALGLVHGLERGGDEAGLGAGHALAVALGRGGVARIRQAPRSWRRWWPGWRLRTWRCRS